MCWSCRRNYYRRIVDRLVGATQSDTS
jgi:hypothetical protein